MANGHSHRSVRDVPDDIWSRAKAAAALRNIQLNHWISEALAGQAEREERARAERKK
mgnify:CR=1 FL=1